MYIKTNGHLVISAYFAFKVTTLEPFKAAQLSERLLILARLQEGFRHRKP